MKRFTGNEIAGLALAALLFVGGTSLVIWPQAGLVARETRHPDLANVAPFDSVNAPKSRTVGVIAIAFGAGLAAIIVNGRNK